MKRNGVKLSDEQEKQLEELNGKLKTANQEFQNFLDESPKIFKKAKITGLKTSTS